MPGWGQWFRRAAGLLAGLISVAAALTAGLLTPYLLAARTANLRILSLSAILSFGAIAWLGTKAALTIWPGPQTMKRAAPVAGVLTFAFLSLLYLFVLRSSGSTFPDVIQYENTRYWRLPTGSMIAYSEYDPPPGVAVKPEAIVYLHGGPGARQGPFDQRIYGEFARQGFRVFLFDQAGSGLSGFLPHLRDYTIHRSIEDLEEVRRAIGVERMILIGHSWGSTLAASYMARYPSHVAKVVFHSPARIWDLAQEDFDYSRTAAGAQALPAPRLLAALLLRDRNSDAAENLLPQKEAEMLLIPFFRQTLGTVVCAGHFDKLPPDLVAVLDGHENPGVNPYVLQELVLATENPEQDPHPALRSNDTPAIVLYPECNYLSWKGTLDYRNTLQNINLYYILGAGHYIQFEQADLLERVILAFLLDEPEVMPAYASDGDPRTDQSRPDPSGHGAGGDGEGR